ncbi:MAG: hypothetical protein J5733_02235 [Bacteroidaceae bacterium]|nr:hypothetical protein [Bacteroidaceae bacterium]
MQQPNLIDVLAGIVGNLSGNVTMLMKSSYDNTEHECKPEITYMFGDAQYIKDQLDEYSKVTGVEKLPLIALFTPVKEKRGLADYAAEATVSLLIACSSRTEWNNFERKEYSFEKILRPIYDAFMDALKASKQIESSYDGSIPHVYSENYSYGKYGAYTASGEAVSEPIDAINISDLKLLIKNLTCIRK